MFERGDLVLIPFPFSDLSAAKKRPVLLLTRPDARCFPRQPASTLLTTTSPYEPGHDAWVGAPGDLPRFPYRLARFFGDSAMFWLDLQTAYELAVAEEALGERITEEVKPTAA